MINFPRFLLNLSFQNEHELDFLTDVIVVREQIKKN